VNASSDPNIAVQQLTAMAQLYYAVSMASERRFPNRRDVIFVIAVAYLGANVLVALPPRGGDTLVINVVVRGRCGLAIAWFIWWYYRKSDAPMSNTWVAAIGRGIEIGSVVIAVVALLGLAVWLINAPI
jgi:hypothetical protein